MARFSVEREADDEGEGGPSGPTPKRPRRTYLYYQSSSRRYASIDDDEEEEEEEQQQQEDEESEEEEENDDDDDENLNAQVTIVEAPPPPPSPPPRSSEAVGPTRNNAICVTLTDPDVLDCPVCYDSLTIPVFQCENGHTACSSCCKKLAQKCPSCSLPIGYNRCRAIEKVLESVKLPCHNLKYGCKEMVCLSKKFEHDKVCKNAPCSCPQSGCNYVGSSRQLYQHFSNKHKGSASRFQYNITFPVFFPLNHKFLILQEEKEGVVFILKNELEILGNVITVKCIGPPSSKGGYFYEVAARIEGSNLKFQSFTKNVQKAGDDDNSDTFLVVPSSFCGSFGQISLDLCIWRHGTYPAGIQASSLNIPSTVANVLKNTGVV